MRLFQSLSKEEKIDFFVRCQDLLIKHHNQSEFLFTQENYSERKDFALNFIERYNGYIFSNENICLLYNKIKIKDEKTPVKAIRENMYQAPDPNYNAIIVDFATFDILEHVIEFFKTQMEERLKFILYVKKNHPKIYRAAQLLKAIEPPFKIISN